jgi:hypothetical protein
MDFTQKKAFTFEEGCHLGYAKSYGHKLLSSGILPYSKPNNKPIFYDREFLEKWMQSNAKSSYTEKQIGAATYVKTKGGVNDYEK